MAHRIMPDVIADQNLAILAPSDSVYDAAQAMAARNIGAVLVVEAGVLTGILTERDIAHRVVAAGLDPATTQTQQVMTADPTTIAADLEPSKALDIMRKLNCRHLPVVDGPRIIGILSIRDLYSKIHVELQEDLRLRDHLFRSGYSMTY